MKKGTKKKKAVKPEIVYYSPVDSISKGTKYIGLALRTLILYLGVFGITSFVLGAAGLTYSDWWGSEVVSPGTIALYSIPVALAAAFASLNKICAFVTPFLYGGIYIGIIAASYGNPIDFIYRSIIRIYNFALYTVSSLGYYSLGDYMVNDGYDYANAAYSTHDPYRFAGAFILASIIGFILYFCVQRKTRLFPIVLLISVIFAPILTYNIAQGTAGFGFIIVFICSAIALKIYDHRYGGQAEKKALKKKLKAEKKAQKKAHKAEAVLEKKTLIAEADRVYDKAIDADIPHSKAKKARKAVFENHKIEKKAKKKAAKEEARLAKKAKKAEKKENKKKLRSLSAELKKAKKQNNSDSVEAIKAEISRLKGESTVALDEKRAKKQERKKAKKNLAKRRREISMAGGFAGFGVALCVFLAVWIPMSTISGPFLTIEPLNDRIQVLRAYTTAYLRGSDVDLNDTYVYGLYQLAPRQLTFDPLELDEDLLFRVDAPKKTNVYLRSWVGTDFDWDNEAWLSATYDDVRLYRNEFGKGYNPDAIKANFYKYVYPSTTVIDGPDTYKNFSRYGFVVEQIDVWRVRSSGLLVFIPSHMDTDMGIMNYKSTLPVSYKHQSYFDGTYSSLEFDSGKGYSTLSYITALNRADVKDSMEMSLEYYELAKEAITAAPDAIGDEATSIVYKFEKFCNDNGIEINGTSLPDRYYFSMTEAEKEELLESFAAEEKYRAYAKETYTAKSENEAVASIATEISSNALATDDDGTLTPHETVNAIREYFNTNFTYTEAPNEKLASISKSVLENFLTNVKEGYCTHFASAAVMLLRECGIPARYVEGYVADDFESMGDEDSEKRASIYGTDAHAWVEIYVDNMGWMMYEVTPGKLSDDMYDPNSNTVDDVTIPDYEDGDTIVPTEPDSDKFPGDVDPDNIVPPTSDDGDISTDESNDLYTLLIIIIIALAACAVIFLISLLVRYIRKRAWEAMNERFTLIDTAKNTEDFKNPERDNRSMAKQINDWIMDVFATIDCQPAPGEIPSQFVERMREDYGNLSKVDIGDVIEAMQKEEFGHGLTPQELALLGEYLEDIISSVYAGMSLWKKLITRYFKRKI